MPIFKEGTIYSITHSKCPKCNLGDLYVDNHLYHLRKLGEMKRKCEFCGQLYEPETGFYYGAMYVSYGLSIIAMFIPAFALYMIFDAGFKILLATVIGIYIFLFPVFFRWSRNIWLNIFVKYDAELKKKILSENNHFKISGSGSQ